MSEGPKSLDGLRIERREASPSRMGRYVIWAIVTIAVLAAVLAWSFKRAYAVEVRTAVARAQTTAGPDRTVLNASGYVTARREATVSSKVTAKVKDIGIEEGMSVTEGQVLARLDATNVEASLKLAQAQAAATKAALSEIRVRLREAEQELRRQADLKSREVLAQADFDHAEAAVLALRARIEQQEAEAAVADRTVAVWTQQLDDTVIRAPFGGTVTSKNAQPGEMISPMSTGGFTRTGICTIVDMQSLEIEIDVNESYINRVSAGQPVEATLDAYPDWKIPCHVIAIIPTADRNKSTVRVRVGFDKLDARILPDMSAKVAFRETTTTGAAPRPGVIVPKAAITQQDGRTVILVVREEQVERRAISATNAEADEVVITSGLSAGERVVLNPPAGLADGARVKSIAP